MDSLDLDALVPQDKTVKVNGKVYKIKPITLKEFINFQRILRKAQGKSEAEMVDLMGEIFNSIKAVVPQVEEMNLTMQQTLALMTFIYKQEEAPKTTEKKMEVSSSQ